MGLKDHLINLKARFAQIHPLTKWMSEQWSWVTPGGFGLGAWGVSEYLASIILFCLSGVMLVLKAIHWETPRKILRIAGGIFAVLFIFGLCWAVNVQRGSEPLSKVYAKWQEAHRSTPSQHAQQSTPQQQPGQDGNQEPPQRTGAPKPERKSEPRFARPEVLDFESLHGTTITNNSGESLFLLRVGASIESTLSPGNESVSFPLDFDLGPSQARSFDFKTSGTYNTMPPMVGRFQDQWRQATEQLRGCVIVAFFSPTDAALKQIEDHYASERGNLGVGDAQGTIVYERKNSSATITDRFPLKAILFRVQNCQPTSSGRDSNPQAETPEHPVLPDVSLKFVYPEDPALLIVNPSDSVARDMKWGVILWNRDLPDRNDPLPIPFQDFDWLKPHTEGGPEDLGSVQTFSHFQSSVLLRKVVGFGCFASGPHGGQKQSGQAMATISASRSICR